MKKNKAKKIVALFLMSVMLLGMSTVASATEHVCAFSYMGTNPCGTKHVTYHNYTTYENDVSVTKVCEVVVDQYEEIWKCACGAIEHRNKHGVVRHTAHIIW